ncbi:hypothetical protein KMW28_27265 [Flammeovirga yaeyamensis]|uniref:Peptidase M48 domain-containing protein n=1 Tax=Flammeovirga yaeyamensis TaxID=367791 RepID=A0AAX1NDN8_9BACT|nr:hypothetical protein [Flammeovirga yaeyamensis]MBB3700018.1 uncharacterized protein YeeX (DUF496 family) [Flammeovirga yaeyamensis]NMF37544.1 hypothetical protein [Flammeovirga yaeyamensis]QWG04601.1 hypothetical protein KMW28_27265 [Flammeovirga yaeyamensis]
MTTRNSNQVIANIRDIENAIVNKIMESRKEGESNEAFNFMQPNYMKYFTEQPNILRLMQAYANNAMQPLTVCMFGLDGFQNEDSSIADASYNQVFNYIAIAKRDISDDKLDSLFAHEMSHAIMRAQFNENMIKMINRDMKNPYEKRVDEAIAHIVGDNITKVDNIVEYLQGDFDVPSNVELTRDEIKSSGLYRLFMSNFN